MKPAFVILALTAAAYAREPEAMTGPAAEDRVASFLADHGLEEVLAAVHRQKLADGTADEKRDAAEALGVIYAKQLAATNDAAERQKLEDRCRELLRLMPDVDGFELRINLAKSTYLKAEEIAERDRLRLADEAERAEAIRILEQVGPAFKDIAGRVHRRHDTLDRQLDQTPEDKAEALRETVTDLRRLRSLARYYAGWSDLYTAMLTGRTQSAQSSLEQFGWLLNAQENKAPLLDRLPMSLLKYEHVARAAMGVGMALAQKGQREDALRWLEAVQHAEDVPAPVREQVFVRRMGVMAMAGQWLQLETALKERQAKTGAQREILAPASARYIVILAMEHLQKAGADMQTQAARGVASMAMGELVSRGDLAQVLDLAKRFGAEILGDKGFIPIYVRAVQAYDRVREQHKAAGSADEPTANPAIAQVYAASAAGFARAAAEPDAASFAQARTRCTLLEGLARYYAGELATAADRFDSVAKSDAPEEVRRDAMWYAVLSLERAVDRGNASLAERRDKASILFITTYPANENAARLLVRRSGTGLLTEDKAVEILLAVPEDSPVRGLAQRQAAKLLYQIYRRAQGKDRDAAALRFTGIAEMVLASESARSLDDISQQSAKDAAATTVLYARQIADALLSMTAPDATRAENALAMIEKIALVHQMDMKPFEAEIGFRRLQIALARGDEPEAAKWIARLGGEAGEYPRAAMRLMYRRSYETWQASARPESARRVVEFGQKVIQLVEGEGTKLPDPSLASVYDAVAAAAASLAKDDTTMRSLAITLDKALVAAKLKTESVLRRTARLSEAAGDDLAALDAWRELGNALEPGKSAWAEARYESLRLQAKSEPDAAKAALIQHQSLYPSWGPEPWGAKLAELASSLGIGPAGGGR